MIQIENIDGGFFFSHLLPRTARDVNRCLLSSRYRYDETGEDTNLSTGYSDIKFMRDLEG